MASTKKEETPQTAQPKPSILKSPAIPAVLIVACFAVALLAQAGYINLPHLGKQIEAMFETLVGNELENADTIKMEDGLVGDPYEDGVELTNLEGRDTTGDTYYQDPDSPGDLPPGITLSSDGTLSGTPTKVGTYTFVVCAESFYAEVRECQMVSITIKPKEEPSPYRGECPTKPNPPCHSVQQTGEIPVQAEGVLTYDYCECPEGTHPSGTVDRVSPGGPYNICLCD